MRTLNQLKPGETSKIRAWVCFDGMLGRLMGLGLEMNDNMELVEIKKS